jgi:formate hydrogenlyase subunit 3/multisubunit Na+/H+ antiporter MnhD subunit
MTIKAVAKFCSVAAMVLVVFIALGPANWAPRTALGWQFDHFAGYFAITLLVFFACGSRPPVSSSIRHGCSPGWAHLSLAG